MGGTAGALAGMSQKNWTAAIGGRDRRAGEVVVRNENVNEVKKYMRFEHAK